MAEYLIQDTTLTEIADAIREKTGKTEQITVCDMPIKISEIENIINYENTMATSLGDYTFVGFDKFRSVYYSKVETIGRNCFCTTETTPLLYNLVSINFPVATSIGRHCFSGQAGLREVNLPSLISVSVGSFSNCRALKTIVLPAATEIRNLAFSYCYNLSTLVLSSSIMCTCGLNVFYDVPMETLSIYVPDNLVDSYKSATNWSTYASQIKPLSEYTGEI